MKNEMLRADASGVSRTLGITGTDGGAASVSGAAGGSEACVQAAQPQAAQHRQPRQRQRLALTTLPLGLTFTALLVLLVLFALVALCVGRFQVHPLQAVRLSLIHI